MGGYAWVTLATNNSYSLGALVLAHSLKKSKTSHKLVVLVTSSVSESMRNQLGTVFDVVKLVDVLDSKDAAHLALMQRPELGITFTKIHCWRLTEFEKCVFLDADTLVVRNCDELFEREEFSAAPDASWPDCFNSGVFVFRPSIDTFNKILQFAVENKSFDGGDQGLLNQFFSSWATEDIKKHLPFVYNLTSIGSYAYIPAFKHYGAETRIVHFIGTGKPWLQQLDIATRTVTPPSGYEHLAPLLQKWWDLFCEEVHPKLDKNLESSNEGMSHSPVEACSNTLPIALTDVPQTLRLVPCTPHKEKVVTKHNLPFITNENSSGESRKPVPVVVIQPKSESETKRSEPIWREDVHRIESAPVVADEYNKCTDTPVRTEERDKEERIEQQPPEEPPPKDPFDYESFFPDETCIKSYLEQNVVTYQPFESQEEPKEANLPKEPEPLPRFLTIPENDRRQSGNFDLPVENHKPETQSVTEEVKETKKQEEPPRETLTKSKSMPFLPLEVSPEPPRSIWKSQPNVNVDPNKKYSMPKLKPILPKQSSRYVRTKIPKVTHYTEFLMSSEYKDPENLPKDRIGFVETQIHSQKHKRSRQNARAKFGPLPFIPSPETDKPSCKKIRLEHSDDDLYDLTQCKRQSGNKPKPKDVQKKQNGNNLEEILKRLKDFSKDYHHYFGIVPKPRRRTVTCKNAIVQASGSEGECRTSEAFKTVRTGVCSWSRGTQTLPQREEFRSFRNYVKDQNEASQKGLLIITGRGIASPGTKFAEEEDEKTRKGDVIVGESNGLEDEPGRTSPGKNESRLGDVGSQKLNNVCNLLELTEDGGNVPSPNSINGNELSHPSSVVAEENTNNNHSDDVGVNNSNGVSLEIQNSESNVDGVSVKLSEMKITHSESDDVEAVENNKLELQKPNEEDAVPSKVQTEAVVPSKTQSDVPVDENLDENVINNSVTSESPAEEKETVTHSKDPNDDVMRYQQNGLNQQHSECVTNGGEESSRVQTLNNKSEEKSFRDDVTNGVHVSSDEPTTDTNTESVLQSKSKNNPVLGNSVESHINGSAELLKSDSRPGNDSKNDEPPVDGDVNQPNGHPFEQTQTQETVKKPEEILCVPDFETPRSSRVTLKTTDEEITPQKSRKTGASPQNVHERFRNDSPDESAPPLFAGEKKRSPNGNDEPERPEESTPASGIAGAIAQLSLQAGSEQTPESTSASAAHQEYIRRQNWESGNIDYMGKDSFDNIWSKICQTLEAKEEPPATAGDVKKPSDTPSNIPEFIETLSEKPAPGPVEDDECIFSKSDSRQSGLMNISEEEETRGQGVILSDISGLSKTGSGEKSLVSTPDSQLKPSEIKKEAGSSPAEANKQLSGAAVGVTSHPNVVSEGKSEALIPSRDEKAPQSATEKPQSAGEEVKLQPEAAKVTPQPPAKPEEKSQSAGGEIKPQPEAAKVTPQPPVKPEEKPPSAGEEVKPQPEAAKVTPQLPAKPEEKSQSAEGEIKPQPEPAKVTPQPPVKPEEKPPSAEGGIKLQPEPAKVTPQPPVKPDEKPPSAGEEVKPQPEPAKVTPQPPGKPEEKPPSLEGEIKPQPEPAKVTPQPPIKPEEKPQLAITDTKSQLPAAPVEVTPAPNSSKPAEECKVVAIPSPPILPPGTLPKSKKQVEKPQVQLEPIPLPPPDSPSSEQPVKTTRSDSLKDDGKQKKGVFTKILEMVGVKDKNGSEGNKSVFYDVESSGKEKEVEDGAKEGVKSVEATQPEVKETQKAEKKEPETVQLKPKPERSPKDPQQSNQGSETKRKSPSPKLTMPQTPETAVITPTPPPSQEILPMKNSGLLTVEETILETPPVPEPSNVQTEIEDIIEKAKTEVKTLLQDCAEKGASDEVNTMKLILGEEQGEVEELKVTSEEERKRHKGEVVSSKLSDQILKAIPPPRRKAISDATASTSAIPKVTPELKSPQTAEGKTKSSKPSSIPVPPPRNKGKPQPPPSKSKGKK